MLPRHAPLLRAAYEQQGGETHCFMTGANLIDDPLSIPVRAGVLKILIIIKIQILTGDGAVSWIDPGPDSGLCLDRSATGEDEELMDGWMGR